MKDAIHISPCNRAAVDNLSPHWHGVFTKLGLNVVVVLFDTRLDSPIHSHPEIEKALGLELQQELAGFYDSTFYHVGSVWHFFHCVDLGKAMQRLKSQLEARGLLHITNILHAEESNQLRFWYSPDANAIGKALEG